MRELIGRSEESAVISRGTRECAPSARQNRPSPTAASGGVLALQSTVGNHAVTGLLGRPDTRASARSGSTGRAGGASAASRRPRGGQPLDSGTQRLMEGRFEQNFAGVRVHTGPAASAAADAVDAKAFTVGEHVVFGHARYRPDTELTRRLLAHELAHVIQQRRAQTGQRAGADLEPKARDAERDFLRGNAPVEVRGEGGPRVTRQPLDQSVNPRDLSLEQLEERIGRIRDKRGPYPTSSPENDVLTASLAHLEEEVQRRRDSNAEQRPSTTEGRTRRARRAARIDALLQEPSSLGHSVDPTPFEPDVLQAEIKRIDDWLSRHRDPTVEDHLRRECAALHAELKRKQQMDERWAKYKSSLDNAWNRTDSGYSRWSALLGYKRFMSFEEFDEQLKRRPGFRALFERFRKFYSKEPKGFNIETRHIGEVGGRPISAATIEDYTRQKNAIELAQLGDELFLGPIRDTLTGVVSKPVAVAFAVHGSYEAGVSSVEAVTGESSGAHVRDLASGAPDVGRKLSGEKRVLRGVESTLHAVASGLSLRRPKVPASVGDTPRQPSRPIAAEVRRASEPTTPPRKVPAPPKPPAAKPKPPTKQPAPGKPRAPAPKDKPSPARSEAAPSKKPKPEKGKESPAALSPEQAAGFTKEQAAQAGRVLGQPMTTPATQRLASIWDDVANPSHRAKLSKNNSRSLFNNHRRRFWRAVRRDPVARKIFEDMGAVFPKGKTSAPVVTFKNGRKTRITIDHMVERQANPGRALDPSNLRFTFTRENTVLLRLIHALDPFQ